MVSRVKKVHKYKKHRSTYIFSVLRLKIYNNFNAGSQKLVEKVSVLVHFDLSSLAPSNDYFQRDSTKGIISIPFQS